MNALLFSGCTGAALTLATKVDAQCRDMNSTAEQETMQRGPSEHSTAQHTESELNIARLFLFLSLSLFFPLPLPLSLS